MFSKTKLQWKFIVAFTRHTSAAIDLILQDMPLHTRRRMQLMHDGAPSHYNSDVGYFSEWRISATRVGQGGPTAWPARSPDLNPVVAQL
jgi:hypothetical protein